MNDTVFDFDRIYADYHQRIQRYLARLVGEDDAEDLTQVVFTRVSQNLDTFRGDAQLSTWIFRIASNAAFDRMREASFQQKRQSVPLDDPSAPGVDIADQDLWSGEPAPSIEQQIHHRQRDACYCDMLNTLPENYRLIVTLNEVEGFCAKEIAAMLGLSIDVVKIRLHRGRDRLIQELKKHCRAEDWL